MDDLTIRLINVDLIRPNEECDLQHVAHLTAQIHQYQRWTSPIVLDRDSYAVMDGHHRLAAARCMGFRQVPCLLLSYVDVIVEARRCGFDVSPSEIVRRSLCSELYPLKTTRHVFSSELPHCSVPLHLLKLGALCNVGAASPTCELTTRAIERSGTEGAQDI